MAAAMGLQVACLLLPLPLPSRLERQRAGEGGFCLVLMFFSLLLYSLFVNVVLPFSPNSWVFLPLQANF